jgi:hypothetical protein
MSTGMLATSGLEIGATIVMNQSKQLRPELEEIVQDLVALRAIAKDGVVLTHHSQRELVKHLNAQDLAAVARAVSLEEKRQQPIYAHKAR